MEDKKTFCGWSCVRHMLTGSASRALEPPALRWDVANRSTEGAKDPGQTWAVTAK